VIIVLCKTDSTYSIVGVIMQWSHSQELY